MDQLKSGHLLYFLLFFIFTLFPSVVFTPSPSLMILLACLSLFYDFPRFLSLSVLFLPRLPLSYPPCLSFTLYFIIFHVSSLCQCCFYPVCVFCVVSFFLYLVCLCHDRPCLSFTFYYFPCFLFVSVVPLTASISTQPACHLFCIGITVNFLLSSVSISYPGCLYP